MGDINDTLTDVGDGLGSLLTSIAVPVGTILVIVISISAVGAILYGVAKAISTRM